MEMSIEQSEISGTAELHSGSSEVKLTSDGNRIIYRFAPGSFSHYGGVCIDRSVDVEVSEYGIELPLSAKLDEEFCEGKNKSCGGHENCE